MFKIGTRKKYKLVTTSTIIKYDFALPRLFFLTFLYKHITLNNTTTINGAHSEMKRLIGKLPILSELAPSPKMLQNTNGSTRMYRNAANKTSINK